MSVVRYPARVIAHKVFFSESNAQLKLFGLEDGEEADAEVFIATKTLANIDFVHIKENASPSFKAFINRGGYLQTTRPLWLLSSILVLLEKGGNIRIDGNGNLSKTQTLDEVLT